MGHMADNNALPVTSLKLKASLAAVTGLGDRTDQVFAGWADTVTPAEGKVRFGSRTSAAVARVAWHVEADTPAMVPNLGGWLHEFGLPQDEAQRFTKTTALLEPARLGGIIEYADGLGAGWYLPLDANVYDVFSLEKQTNDLYEVSGWCENQKVERCSRLVRLVGTFQSEIWMPVPGTGEKAMAVALNALEALLKSTPPAAASTALNAAAGGGVDVVIGHRDVGVTFVGINVRRPSTAQVLALARSVDNRDERRLAAFEGALGVNGPASAEYRVYSNRTELLLSYEVA
jgi:hypothetical protein